jgi:hypothetical protein
MIRIGFAGYSDKKFDKQKAIELIKESLDDLTEDHKKKDIRVVSGLTNLGIPGLVYKEAEKRGYYTIGIACKKAEDYECFDCDEKIIVGDEWGDESEKFLDSIDVLVRIGGGKQTIAETKKAKSLGIKVVEHDLEETK